MSTMILLLFMLGFGILLALTLRESALAIPLGIMTYSYKQIALLALPFLQNQGALFNYAMAGAFAAVFLFNLVFKHPGVTCKTPEGKRVELLVWAFLALFWISLLWSPFYGTEAVKFYPYFIVYFYMLPALMQTPREMIRAFYGVWFVTLLGGAGLVLSPAFHMSEDLGRMVVHFEAGKVVEATPLAIADMGAYLVILSTLVLLPVFPFKARGRSGRALQGLLAVGGLGLGFYLAFNTSRGETITSLACACLLIALTLGRSIRQSVVWVVSAFSALSLVLAVVFTVFTSSPGASLAAQRYTPSALAEGGDDRAMLSAQTVKLVSRTPKDFLFGMGARACEKDLGMYPHNQFVQALGETGILGLLLLAASWAAVLHFGFRTLNRVRGSQDPTLAVFVSLILTLAFYELIVLSKKGSLTFVDTYMWISLAAFAFDRATLAARGLGQGPVPGQSRG